MREIIIGIDEVGRGPLAGPVTVVAFATIAGYKVHKAIKSKTPLRDSKRLSKKQREEWVAIFKKLNREGKVHYTVASVSPKIIDEINITKAANKAATKALRGVIAHNKIHIEQAKVFLDGGLYLQKPYVGIGETIIKGDEKIPAISCASIIAKTYRDRQMERLHIKYPRYKFNVHKGYGTNEHIRAIKKHGISAIHRLTFTKKYTKVKRTY